MLINFENEEFKIADKDLHLVDTIKELLVDILKPEVIKKSPDLCYLLNWRLSSEMGIYEAITPVKLRKWVSYFRSMGDLPIIATSEGYFITHDKEIIESQILSLKQRASQIERAADGLKKFLH